MANGKYAVSLHDLDVDFSKACAIRAGDPSILDCPYAYWDNINGSAAGEDFSTNKIGIYFAGAEKGNSYANPDVKVYLWFEQSDYPFQITCAAVTLFGTRLCKNMKF